MDGDCAQVGSLAEASAIAPIGTRPYLGSAQRQTLHGRDVTKRRRIECRLGLGNSRRVAPVYLGAGGAANRKPCVKPQFKRPFLPQMRGANPPPVGYACRFVPQFGGSRQWPRPSARIPRGRGPSTPGLGGLSSTSGRLDGRRRDIPKCLGSPAPRNTREPVRSVRPPTTAGRALSTRKHERPHRITGGSKMRRASDAGGSSDHPIARADQRAARRLAQRLGGNPDAATARTAFDNWAHETTHRYSGTARWE